MSLKKHINSKIRAASYNLNKIRQIRKCLTVDSCKSVVLGLVISHIDYCNALLLGLPCSSLLPLQSIQNQAAKLILFKKKYDSAKECLRSLHWLPIEQRIKFKVLCLVYECINKQAPDYLSNLFSRRTSTYNIRSISSYTLHVSSTRTKRCGNRAFSVAGARLWNGLPLEIQGRPSFPSFKSSLKPFLFREAFG